MAGPYSAHYSGISLGTIGILMKNSNSGIIGLTFLRTVLHAQSRLKVNRPHTGQISLALETGM